MVNKLLIFHIIGTHIDLYSYIIQIYLYVCLKSASTNKLHLLNLLTVKERMEDEVVMAFERV